jgi:hypothetical protein
MARPALGGALRLFPGVEHTLDVIPEEVYP